MTRPRAYIAGPMRGHEHANFPAFDEAAWFLESRGYVAINPAQMDRLFEGWGETPPDHATITLEDRKRFIRRDILVITELEPARGDIIYLLKGWDESSGAQTEAALGVFLGLRLVEEGMII